MFLSVIYYQVEDMHQLPTVGSHHGQPGVTGGLVKISQQQYFSALFLLTHVTPSHVTITPACGSSDQGIEDIDSSSHVV